MSEKTSAPDSIYQSIVLFFDSRTVLDFLEKYELSTLSATRENASHVFSYDHFISHFVNRQSVRSLFGISYSVLNRELPYLVIPKHSN